MKKNEVFFIDLGYTSYKYIWLYQKNIFNNIKNIKLYNRKYIKNNIKKNTIDYLLFVQHNHVYTIGKTGNSSHLLFSKDLLKKINAVFYKVDRGGSATYHGPGQLVIYPILNLEHFFCDINKYLRSLEEVIIKTISFYGLKGYRLHGNTGVWIYNNNNYKKICSIGIRVSNWITMHGLALNINTDLKYFQYIIPCGITNKKMTSINNEIKVKISLEEIKIIFKYYFEKIFNVILI